MSNWLPLVQKPDKVGEGEGVEDWFAQIACQLLNNSRLVVGEEPYRLVEIEFYYYGDDHPDAFTHCDRLQREWGRWYFHRSRGMYRSGSFKGLDVTFGDGKAFGGILIRSMEAPDGTLIDGPSLCVDRLLALAGVEAVADLDESIGGRVVWDTGSPMVLALAHKSEQHQIFRSARVGLSLKKAKSPSDLPRYIMRPYRFVTEPRRISKGKLYLVLALHVQGINNEIIHQITGCPRQTIQRYIADFEAGRLDMDFAPYFGIDLKPKDLCRLYGTWHANCSGMG